MENQALPPFRPYILAAAFKYCKDIGLAPYIQVQYDPESKDLVVPVEAVVDGRITLNLSDFALKDGLMEWEHEGEKGWTFTFSLKGKPFCCYIPYRNIVAIHSADGEVILPFEDDEYPELQKTPKENKPSKPVLGVVQGGKKH